MSAAPTLGELARQTRVVDAKTLDDLLRLQRQAYAEGDFRRLGEIMVDHGRANRPGVRGLLQRQGITIAECELCSTRYNALMFRGPGTCLCLRCGRRLVPSDERAPLAVEDAISGGGPQADRMLAEHRQRNPRIGRHEVLGQVGRGAMGVIYKAWDADLHRHVALKFLRPGPEGISQEDKERFRREARALARLRHEHIVQCHAIEEQSGLVYLTMDFVPGVPMEMLARRGALAVDQVVGIGAKISRALHHAHEQGIVHRDVKPGNIVIDRHGVPFLVDFGIAKSRTESTSLTTEGEILGSLAYMAPEYITKGSQALDRRCDVYGIGVAVYEALSGGKLPFGEDEDERLVMRILKEPPTPLATYKKDLPPGLEAVVMRAIHRDREQRYHTCAQFADDLEAVGKGPAALEESQKRRGEKPTLGTSGKLAVAPAPGSSGRLTPLDHANDGDIPSSELDAQKLLRGGETPAGAPAPASGGLGLIAGWALAVVATVAALGGVALWRGAEGRIAAAEARARERGQQAGKALLELGRALEQARNLKGAEARFGEAAELLPDDPAPLEARASVRERSGDVSGALNDRIEAKTRKDRGAPTPQ